MDACLLGPREMTELSDRLTYIFYECGSNTSFSVICARRASGDVGRNDNAFDAHGHGADASHSTAELYERLTYFFVWGRK